MPRKPASPVSRCERCNDLVAPSNHARHAARCGPRLPAGVAACPTCSRAFASDTLDRHVRKCKGALIPCPLCSARLRPTRLPGHLRVCPYRDLRERPRGDPLNPSATPLMKVERCTDCHRRIGVQRIPGTNTYRSCEIVDGRAGATHSCDGTPAENDAPVGLSGGNPETNRRRH